MTYFIPNSQQSIIPTQYANPGMYYSNPGNNTQYRFPPAGKYGAAYAKVATASVWLGSLMIVCGCISISGAVVSMMSYADGWFVGTGFWCGAMFVSTGSVAIAAGHHLTDSLILATTATSPITIVLGGIQLGLSAYFLTEDLRYYRCPYEYRYCSCDYDGYYNRCYSSCYYYCSGQLFWESCAITSNSILIGAGSLSIVFGLSLFIIACRSVCSFTTQQSQQVIVMPIQCMPNAPQQMSNGATSNQMMLSVPTSFGSIYQQPFFSNPPQTNYYQPPLILNPATSSSDATHRSALAALTEPEREEIDEKL